MGLFTSMVPMYNRNAGTRFLPSGPADTMHKFNIYAWKGFLTLDQVHGVSARLDATREYRSLNVLLCFIRDK